eukprot:1159175-Pelagomonas_calceolata.AAC.1
MFLIGLVWLQAHFASAKLPRQADVQLCNPSLLFPCVIQARLACTFIVESVSLFSPPFSLCSPHQHFTAGIAQLECWAWFKVKNVQQTNRERITCAITWAFQGLLEAASCKYDEVHGNHKKALGQNARPVG